jgi:hypothetical protein
MSQVLLRYLIRHLTFALVCVLSAAFVTPVFAEVDRPNEHGGICIECLFYRNSLHHESKLDKFYFHRRPRFPESIGVSRTAGAIAIQLHSNGYMSVYQNGHLMHQWPMGTPKRAYYTADRRNRLARLEHSGPQRVTASPERVHYSREYHNAPLPFALHIPGPSNGVYIHAGNTARNHTHGCYHLAPENAQTLYEMVRNVQPGSVTAEYVDSGTSVAETATPFGAG